MHRVRQSLNRLFSVLLYNRTHSCRPFVGKNHHPIICFRTDNSANALSSLSLSMFKNNGKNTEVIPKDISDLDEKYQSIKSQKISLFYLEGVP